MKEDIVYGVFTETITESSYTLVQLFHNKKDAHDYANNKSNEAPFVSKYYFVRELKVK